MIDIRAAAERINAQNRRENAAIAARKLQADTEGRRLARLLGESDPQVRSVWGFGSVYESGRPYRMDSDIDLAVEGGDHFAQLRLVETSTFPVDLVDLDSSGQTFAALVKERAIELYLRPEA
jgi:predicted nucleotidyltransferase